ncbi:hypothetical protein T4B_14411 [Trichinella pseudospiralis]|uniref:Uncharacterized protein n=1 Tax=Trichinella pseudospiralis TaxID=6337 RepID=A0A0V1ITD0_TRIPS|nr:hypothetical protein T4A_12543 [Trichinella pseudospiralis]KRY68199.1 hypothetical protein T4A_7558 [Trichinella pseudospiralis]KRZ20389.1 hypothetical protein T4B_6651 [Trichinella pseudospiralis]KRZ25805.1 hypothetical protein T4B_14411 [Trichinella pseudospiralis]KRZ31695.1 hypothetical protein T4C_4350 [Trichinella pseudospiralis]
MHIEAKQSAAIESELNISIDKSPIRRLPSNRPIREKQRMLRDDKYFHLRDFPLTAAVRNKGTSGRNCIKYGVEFHYEQYKANISKQLVFSSMQIREIFILLFKFYIIQDISLLTTTKPAFNFDAVRVDRSTAF